MSEPQAPAPGPKQKILVVDDEQGICWAFKQLLQPQGFEVRLRNCCG